jgi:hypothetical protein
MYDRGKQLSFANLLAAYRNHKNPVPRGLDTDRNKQEFFIVSNERPLRSPKTRVVCESPANRKDEKMGLELVV